MDSDRRQRSGLVLVRQTRSVGAEVHHHFEVIRDISTDEYEYAAAGRVFVARLGNHSEHANLSGYVQDFRDAVRDQMVAMATDSQQAIEAFPRTARRFADTLHAFGSFIDRNQAWLSRLAVDHPDGLKDFKEQASKEFDNNAAYRIFAGLRNVSAHVSQVINDARIDGHVVADDVSARTLVLSIDGQELVENHGRRLGAESKATFLSAPGPIHIVPCVERVHPSCWRLHARLGLSVLESFRDTCEALGGMQAEACGESTDAHAWVMKLPKPGMPFEGMIPLSEYRWREILATEPERWRAALEQETPSVTIEELCEQPDLTLHRRRDGTLVDPDETPPSTEYPEDS